MKRLFYSGFLALMMLFAMPGIVRADGEGETGGETTTPQPALYFCNTMMQPLQDNATIGRYYTPFSIVVGTEMSLGDEGVMVNPIPSHTIYYTIDGTTEPTREAYEAQTDKENGAIKKIEYVGEDGGDDWDPSVFTITEADNFVVKAIAYVSNQTATESEGEEEGTGATETTYTKEGTFTFVEVAAPIVDVTAGQVVAGTKVHITNAPAGSQQGMVFYSTDGKTPLHMMLDDEATFYDGEEGIEITGEVGDQITLKAISYISPSGQSGDQAGSKMTTVVYTIKAADVPAPADVTLTFNPASGAEITAGTAVAITASADVEDIYYILYASEAAAKAAAWDQDAAAAYQNGENKPVPTAALPTIKAAYALPDADAVAETFFYATYTVNTPAPLDPLAVTFNPASGSEVAENAEITITVNRDNANIYYILALDSATAYSPNVNFGTDSKTVAEDGKPVIKKDYTFLRCGIFDEGEMKFFNAHYTIKAGETPVDPDKLDVKIEFMTDAYGQARFAWKSDKIRLHMEDPDAVDSMMYAVVAIDADGEETADATYAKYGEALISLADVEGNFRVKAYAQKDTKTSEVFSADYVLLDSIKPALTFDTMTGKNYPVAFDVRSISYPDIMEKDMYVYYSVDGTTEPSDTAFLNGNTALKYVNKEEGLWKNYLNLQENTTVWAKAYVLLDEGANLVMETPVVKQLVKMNALSNPVITPAVAATEYNAGDSIKVAIEAPEDAAMVYYTVDGSEPLYSRLLENEALEDSIIFVYYPSWGDFDTIVVKKSTTIKAIAYKEAAYRPFVPAAGSDIASATYGFKASLAFDPASGSEVYEGARVAITSEDETIDIYYMMFESEEAAKAAEWDQEKAELYTSEMMPVISKKNTTIKAAYLHTGATTVTGNYFYATYTVKERAAVTLTLDPADGAEVEENTKVTVTPSRELEADEYIMFKMFATKKAADTCPDNVMVLESSIYGDPKEDAEYSYPVITKDAPVLKVGMLAGMDENGKWTYNWIVAEYKIKEAPIQANEAGELAGVNVYPNPNAGAFNVAVPERARIDIFGLNGAKVMSREVNAGVEAFQLDHSGIYFVRVMAGNKTAVKRVVVR